MFFLVLFWLFLIILPFPGSAIIWWWIVILGFIFILEVRNLKFVKKIRKWIIFFLKNFKDKQIRNHKIKDFKKHIKDILDNRK